MKLSCVSPSVFVVWRRNSYIRPSIKNHPHPSSGYCLNIILSKLITTMDQFPSLFHNFTFELCSA